MSSQPTPEETVNALAVEIRVLEQTYNDMTSRQGLLERALLESRAALDSLNGLADSPSEMLMPIGGGALLRAQPPSTDKVLLTVGSNIVIEKSREEAVAMLEERSRDFEKTIVSLAGQRNEVAKRVNSDRELLNNLVARAQQE